MNRKSVRVESFDNDVTPRNNTMINWSCVRIARLLKEHLQGRRAVCTREKRMGKSMLRQNKAQLEHG